jgi:hypothetical protein
LTYEWLAVVAIEEPDTVGAVLEVPVSDEIVCVEPAKLFWSCNVEESALDADAELGVPLDDALVCVMFGLEDDCVVGEEGGDEEIGETSVGREVVVPSPPPPPTVEVGGLLAGGGLQAAAELLCTTKAGEAAVFPALSFMKKDIEVPVIYEIEEGATNGSFSPYPLQYLLPSLAPSRWLLLESSERVVKQFHLQE